MDTPKLSGKTVRVSRTVGSGTRTVGSGTSNGRKTVGSVVIALCALLAAAACTTLPEPKHKSYSFPEKVAFFGDVKRPYFRIGLVRTKVDFTTLDPAHEESDLCKNYFNKAVEDLVKRAREKGADAVIDVKSVVFYEGQKPETFPKAECSDDGAEGQVLAQGIAVKWIPEPSPSPSRFPTR